MRVLPWIALVVGLLTGPLPVRAAEKDVETKLSARIDEVHVAGGGRFLVLKLKGSRDLAVYDATTQKLSQIELPDDDFALTAGGETAVVFLRDRNEIRTLDLKTGKELKKKEFIDRPNLIAMAMGHSRDDSAVLRMGRTPAGGGGQDLLLDVNELRVSPLKYQFAPGTGGRPTEQSQLRANGDMSRLVEWAATPTPSGAAILSRNDTGYAYLFGYVTLGPVIPGDDGRVYTTMGTTMEPDPGYNPNFGGSPFKVSTAIKGRTLVPALGGQFLLGVSREGGLTLYLTRSPEPVCPLGEFPGWAPNKPDPNAPGGFPGGFRLPDGRMVQMEDMGPGAIGEGKETLTLDRRLIFSPGHEHILFVPHSNDRIIQRKFDLKATLDQTGEEYLLVLSAPSLRARGGQLWEYQLKAVAKHAPVKFELTKGPEGITITPEGKVAWTAPRGILGRAPVEVKLTDAKGRVARQAFDIALD